MKKNLSQLIKAIGKQDDKIIGGFFGIKGGSSQMSLKVNGAETCKNTGTCVGSNWNTCENTGDCGGTTNETKCSNSTTCFH